MSDIHPINRTLLMLLDNQVNRTRCALEGLDPAVFTRGPGGDCHSIRDIGRHLIALRGFQIKLLESPLFADMPDKEVDALDELAQRLDAATELVRRAIEAHDPADWHARPAAPREGPWGDEPTLDRLVRPFNDFTNHLGGIRVIRRMFDNPAEQTQ